MHKRERHFDDPLPPVPPPLSLSEMGTQSSLNLTTAKNPPNDYSMLPPTPYDMMNAANGQKYPTHFGVSHTTRGRCNCVVEELTMVQIMKALVEIFFGKHLHLNRKACIEMVPRKQ